MTQPWRVGILGCGGLGKTAAAVLEPREEMRLVAMCDTHGWAHRPEGIAASEVEPLAPGDTLASLPIGRASDDPIGEVIALAAAGEIDGLFLALPNLPSDFIPSVIRRIAESGFQGVSVDALKRTVAVEAILALDDVIREAGMIHMTGCGATPGLLTAAAALAAQSFQTIEDVQIEFGVGIANWEAYRATVREDIAHQRGMDFERARAMTDEEVERFLDEREGILELHEMEHADDIMLEQAGVVTRERVKVGGIVDTRHARKPVSTNVRVTGVTFEGRRSTHTFTLGDETSMAANVNGPAFGYMKTGLWLRGRGITGVFTSADVMPRFVR
ncbi:saccharopine dehydrogenase-like oxidoreductase [Candidatus Sumerlaeota bacterium]|nr:saccharopine dehydrogenase-like oxidoreductase [Candidatus Sumerlaeota bacterium]